MLGNRCYLLGEKSVSPQQLCQSFKPCETEGRDGNGLNLLNDNQALSPSLPLLRFPPSPLLDVAEFSLAPVVLPVEHALRLLPVGQLLRHHQVLDQVDLLQAVQEMLSHVLMIDQWYTHMNELPQCGIMTWNLSIAKSMGSYALTRSRLEPRFSQNRAAHAL